MFLQRGQACRDTVLVIPMTRSLFFIGGVYASPSLSGSR